MKSPLVLTALAAVILLLAYCKGQSATRQSQSITNDSLLKRGEYLVTIMGCEDCHSPKLFGAQGPYPDPEKRLSGHPAAMPVADYDTATTKNWVLFNPFNTAIVGPWGTSFSANLTSHETGIGSWTEQQFFKAMRAGKYKGLDNTRPILPPMPWPSYKSTSDEDLKAIFAFLKSTKPIDNMVPAPRPPGRK